MIVKPPIVTRSTVTVTRLLNTGEFQGFHNDITDFFDDLFTQVRHEIELLKQMATGGAGEGGEVLADQVLESVVKLVENVSSSRKEEGIQERLSQENEFDYEAMDMPNKFGYLQFHTVKVK